MNRTVLAAATMAAGWAPPAWACTLCHSPAAQDVRMAVLGVDFWSNLLTLLLPFPVLFAAVLLVRRAAP